MTSMLDQARNVREEDQLDAGRLDAFLKNAIEGLEGKPTIQQFHGGASNLTYLVKYGTRAMVLRRPPTGANAAGAHDMQREATVMAALRPSFPFVPQILARCDDSSIFGVPFYVMERLEGVILRRDLPTELGLEKNGIRRLCETFIDRLIELHSIDVSRPEIAVLGKGEGYLVRQLAGWTERWRRSVIDGTDPCADVITWLDAVRPNGEQRLCVVHNDYRFDNVVLDAEDPQRIIGILDWEMATIGDPLMDLGGSLAYWVEATDEPVFQAFRRQPTHMSGMMTRREVVEYYGERTGLDVERFAFYEVFGLFRLMVIVQQIYRRFVLGQTTNEQFAQFGVAVRYLGERCRSLIRAAESKQ